MKFSFNTIVAPTYKGRDYNYYIQPLKEYGAAYKEVEKDYADLIAQTEMWKVKANQEENPIAYDMYKRYSSMLSEASANFSRGMTQANRKVLLGLKKNYAQEIVPIAEAAKALDAANAEITKNGPDAIYHKSGPLKIDDFLHGAKPNNKYSSAKGITAKVTAGMTSLKAAYKGAPTLTKGVRGKDLETSGFSGLTVEDRQVLDNITPDNYDDNPWLQVPSSNEQNQPSINLRRAAAKFKVDTLKAEGWDDMDDEAKKKALNAANQGLLAVMETPDSKYVASTASTEGLNNLKYLEELNDWNMYTKSKDYGVKTFKEYQAERSNKSSATSSGSTSTVKDNAFIMGEIQKTLNGDTSSTAILTNETYQGMPVFSLKTSNSGSAKKYVVIKDENGNAVLQDVSSVKQETSVKTPDKTTEYDLAQVTTKEAYKAKTTTQSFAFNIDYDDVNTFSSDAPTIIGRTSIYPVKKNTLTKAVKNGDYYTEGTESAGGVPVTIPITYYQGMESAKVKVKDAQAAIYNGLCQIRNKSCADEWLANEEQQQRLYDIVATVNGKIKKSNIGGRVFTSRNIFQLYIDDSGYENDGEDQRILGGMLLASPDIDELTELPQSPILSTEQLKHLNTDQKKALIGEYQQYLDDEVLGDQASEAINYMVNSSVPNNSSGNKPTTTPTTTPTTPTTPTTTKDTTVTTPTTTTTVAKDTTTQSVPAEKAKEKDQDKELALKYIQSEEKTYTQLKTKIAALDSVAQNEAQQLLKNYETARESALQEAKKTNNSKEVADIIKNLTQEINKINLTVTKLNKESIARKKAAIEAQEGAGAISYGSTTYADSTAAANKVNELINK